MNLMLMGLLALAAVGAVALCVQNRDEQDVYHPMQEAPVEEDAAECDEPAEEDAAECDETEAEARTIRATVLASCRTMDPLALQSAGLVTFLTDEGEECTLYIPGEGSLHLREGDTGELTAAGEVFFVFEKDDGEVVGAAFHIPAQREDENA